MTRKKFKERYDFECAACGKLQWAAPSMSMIHWGRNQGHGSCIECKTFLHLEITPDMFGKKMKSEVWDDWLEKQDRKCVN